MSSVKIPSVKEMMEAGVHFGHASGRWHPKMAPYIFATRDKLHIINLEKTQEQLEKVLPVLEDRIANGASFILVGTKRQVAGLVRDLGEKHGLNYVNERWLGGTMTNFGQMMQSISRMKKAEEQLENADTSKMIKKERVMLESDLKRMHARFSGLRNFTKKPDFLIVIDPSFEHNAVKEAHFEGVDIFAIADTNSDPSKVTHVIPANDDGPKSLKLIMGLIEDVIVKGLEKNKVRLASIKQKEEEKKEEEIVVKAPEVEELEKAESKIAEKVEKEVKTTKASKAIKEEKKAIEEAKAEEKAEAKESKKEAKS